MIFSSLETSWFCTLGIVVYDIASGTSWRTTNRLYNPDPFASDYSYQKINFQWTDGVFGASLSPLNKPAGDRVLYYHPMSSFNVSSESLITTIIMMILHVAYVGVCGAHINIT